MDVSVDCLAACAGLTACITQNIFPRTGSTAQSMEEHKDAGGASAGVSPLSARGNSPNNLTGKPTSAGSSLPSTPSKQQRAAPEVEERWREVSGLRSPQEVLLGEFSCSHAGDLIVSQGRIFLSTSHLVFYSSLGALSVKKLIVPWSKVQVGKQAFHVFEVGQFEASSELVLCGSWPKREWEAFFSFVAHLLCSPFLSDPNLSSQSIEKTLSAYEASSGIKVVLHDGDSRSFTQFVARDKVYDTMVRIWNRAPKSDPHESDGESKPLAYESTTFSPVVSASLPSLGPAPAALSPVSQVTAHVATIQNVSLPHPAYSQPVLQQTQNAASAPASLQTAKLPPPKLTSEQPAALNVTTCEHWIEPTTEPAGSATLPFTVEEFVMRFVDDNGAFFNAFHLESGLGGANDCWIKPYPKTENPCCCSRDFNFQQPITTSFPLAPPSTRVKQVHRWFFPGNDTLYLSTSSMMPDITYGSSFSIESKWKVKRNPDKEGYCDVTCYVEGNFFKWLFGFRSTVEQLIKKDGYPYVKGLLDRMTKEGITREKELSAVATAAPQSLFKEPASKSVIRPATIRETPPRLTPPPKKIKSVVGAMQPVMLLVVFVSLVLLAVCVWYLRQLSSTINIVSRPISDSVLDHLKAEVAEMREKLDTIERLLKQLK